MPCNRVLYQKTSNQVNLVLLDAESNRYTHLAPLISQVNVVLKTLKKDQVVSVSIEQTVTRQKSGQV